MFVDACAIVAIISNEAEADEYALALTSAADAFTSVLAAWEAALVLSRNDKLNLNVEVTGKIVQAWLKQNNIEMRNCTAPAAEVYARALHAAATYGVSRRALSNFDCFQYAYAILEDVPMLTLDRLLRTTNLRTRP